MTIFFFWHSKFQRLAVTNSKFEKKYKKKLIFCKFSISIRSVKELSRSIRKEENDNSETAFPSPSVVNMFKRDDYIRTKPDAVFSQWQVLLPLSLKKCSSNLRNLSDFRGLLFCSIFSFRWIPRMSVEFERFLLEIHGIWFKDAVFLF